LFKGEIAIGGKGNGGERGCKQTPALADLAPSEREPRNTLLFVLPRKPKNKKKTGIIVKVQRFSFQISGSNKRLPWICGATYSGPVVRSLRLARFLEVAIRGAFLRIFAVSRCRRIFPIARILATPMTILSVLGCAMAPCFAGDNGLCSSSSVASRPLIPG
jgi:hypothetical protein